MARTQERSLPEANIENKRSRFKKRAAVIIVKLCFFTFWFCILVRFFCDYLRSRFSNWRCNLCKANTVNDEHQEKHDARQEVKPRKCIILTSQCSGSTWLYRSLDSMPSIHFSGELLIRYSRNRSLYETVEWSTYVKHLNSAFASERRPDLIGFKLMYDQLPARFYSYFVSWLEKENVTLLHLRRCAILAYVSHVQKIKRGGLTHITNSSELLVAQNKTQPLKFDRWMLDAAKDLEHKQQQITKYLKVFASRVPVLEVRYEDLDGPFQVLWFGAILSFLQVPSNSFEIRARLKSGTTLKVGSRTCGSRIRSLDLAAIGNLESGAQCAALKILAGELLSENEANLFLPHLDLRTRQNVLRGVEI